MIGWWESHIFFLIASLHVEMNIRRCWCSRCTTWQIIPTASHPTPRYSNWSIVREETLTRPVVLCSGHGSIIATTIPDIYIRILPCWNNMTPIGCETCRYLAYCTLDAWKWNINRIILIEHILIDILMIFWVRSKWRNFFKKKIDSTLFAYWPTRSHDKASITYTFNWLFSDMDPIQSVTRWATQHFQK